MSEEEVRVDIGSLYGYTQLIRRPAFVAMSGDDKRLEVGAIIRLRADSQGHLRDFRDGGTVVIVGFQMPCTDGCTDYVLLASDGTRVAEVKPQNIASVVAAAPRQLRAASPGNPVLP